MRCSVICLGILLLLASACSTPSPTGDVVYLPEGEVVFLSDRNIPNNTPEKYSPPLNISKKSDNNELSCIRLGCASNTQLVADRAQKYFFTCDCKAAEDISINDLVCLRSFIDAHEARYTRSPAC